MFDDQIALEKSQGYRGWATRFFGPIDSVSEADSVIREMSWVFALLAALQAVMAYYHGWLVLLPAAFLVAASLLFRGRHALAAISAVALYLLVAVIFVAVLHGKPGSPLWYAAILGFSWRATRTIVRRRRLLASTSMAAESCRSAPPN